MIIYMKKINLLNNISIVLVDTKTPANIGSVARCMMNMDLSNLILVRPPRDEAHMAAKLAINATGIIDTAKIYESVRDAITPHGLVFGVSRHRGKLRENIHSPAHAAELIMPMLSHNKIAILFGNEINGLSRTDLSLCQEFITIPSSAEFPSLNLSHAVIIIAYEIFIALNKKNLSSKRELAQGVAIEGFYRHLQKTLEEIGFLDCNHSQRMMFSLRQLFGRSRLSARDVSILRGMLSAVNRMAKLTRLK